MRARPHTKTPRDEVGAITTTLARPPAVTAADEVHRCGSATIAVRHCSPTRVAVAAIGEIDAVNGRTLGRCVEQHTRVSVQLVLDLRAVEFFGSPGFTALHFISAHCARRDVDWVMVGSQPVRRLLSICDPEGTLPVVDDLLSALTRLDRLAQCRHHSTWSGQSGWHITERLASTPNRFKPTGAYRTASPKVDSAHH